MIKVLSIFGTRPEAIKMAPVFKALKGDEENFSCRVCVTAQHREMLDQVLDFFEMNTNHDLNIMAEDQSLYDITSKVLEGLQEYLLTERPDFVLVHGDTTTTFAAALAAFYQKIPVGHVEAGLRTGNRYSPFPEEMNRKLASALTDLHFAPTPASCRNLLTENIQRENIVVTGNTAIDALFIARNRVENEIKSSMFSANRRGILVTAHRRENFGTGIRSICTALKTIAEKRKDVEIVYPVHFNPNIRKPVFEILQKIENVTLIDPVGYDTFMKLMADSYLILTDSGGIQEEAPSLGKPVLVLRDCTERPEAVTAGTVELVGTDKEAIVQTTDRLLDDPGEYDRMAQAINPYGDGAAAIRIVAAILKFFGRDSSHYADIREFGE